MYMRRGHVNCHGIARIAAFMQNGIGPETGDFRFMRVPCVRCGWNAFGKHGAKDGVVADAFVKYSYNTLYIGAVNINARW